MGFQPQWSKFQPSLSSNDAGASGNSLNYFSLFNVQGLKPKTRPSSVPYVRDILHEKKQLFICLTETWLDDHLAAEVDIPGYHIRYFVLTEI